MTSRTQTYASHTHRPWLSTIAAMLATAACAVFLMETLRQPGRLAVSGLMLASAVLALVAISRIYIVRLQDRIIRLEMRVRLARLGLDAAYDKLSPPQLVALRFASDAEMGTLIDRTLRERLSSRQIKQAIRDWQPDYRT
jgi:hypothetical protein